MTSTPHAAEAVIVGAGPAGLTAALALAQAGCQTLCAGPPHDPDPARPDTRTTAFLQGSVDFLRRLGLWDACRAHAAPLRKLRMIDDTGRLFRAPDISFDAAEIGAEAFGYNIPNKALVAVLHAAIAETPAASYRETEAVRRVIPEGDCVRLELAEGEALTARLVVGADGRNSLCRTAAGIASHGWSYPQTAIACNFSHSLPHEENCTEFHRPSGPFTLVPLPGENRSSLVWVERREEAARLMTLDDESFAREIEAHSHGLLGAITAVEPRSAFPLSGLVARSYARRRIALVGEAAHVVPPIGAQGLNLGFRDIEALCDAVAGIGRQTGDIGGKEVMAAYNAARRSDILSRTAAIDVLNRSLFADLLPLQMARGVGLFLLNRAGPLRRLVMRQGISPQG